MSPLVSLSSAQGPDSSFCMRLKCPPHIFGLLDEFPTARLPIAPCKHRIRPRSSPATSRALTEATSCSFVAANVLMQDRRWVTSSTTTLPDLQFLVALAFAIRINFPAGSLHCAIDPSDCNSTILLRKATCAACLSELMARSACLRRHSSLLQNFVAQNLGTSWMLGVHGDVVATVFFMSGMIKMSRMCEKMTQRCEIWLHVQALWQMQEDCGHLAF